MPVAERDSATWIVMKMPQCGAIPLFTLIQPQNLD